MSFFPQYSKWGKDSFLSSDGAEFLNSGEYEIFSGAVALRPIVFSGQTFSFDTFWDPVSSWTFQNSLDSLSVISGTSGLSLFASTGYDSPNVGHYGNTGSTYQTAFFTKVNAPVDYNGEWRSGESVGIVWSADPPISNTQFNSLTIDVSIRSLAEDVTHSLSNGPTSGLSCQGLFIGASNVEAFIECHPSGLKIHGSSGLLIPGDFNSRMRQVRFVRNGSRLTVMTDDGQSFASNDGFIRVPTKSSRYLFFGAPPIDSGSFPGSGSYLHPLTGWFDPSGQTGLCGFEGTVLWDDLKVKIGESVITYQDGYAVTWPSGTKTIYTAPWYPSPNISSYSTAFIKCEPHDAGEVTITPQYLVNTGNFSEYSWADYTGVSELIDYYSKTYVGLDISNVPIYYGGHNAIRFKLSANCFGYAQIPIINEITVATTEFPNIVNITPNWKLSSLPKNVIFSTNLDKYKTLIPPSHHQDEIYIHNERQLPYVQTGSYLSGYQHNLSSGRVLSSYSSSGLNKIDDGLYGPAWSNVYSYLGYTGIVFPQSYSNIATGIFHGNLLDSMSVYPLVSNLPTGTTGNTSVGYDIEVYNSVSNGLRYVQSTTIQGWYDATSKQEIGYALTGLTYPTGSNLVGVIKGIIQIPNGPGVKVTLASQNNTGSYYLDGHLYRDPKPFSCSLLYSGSGINSVSFGCLPRVAAPTQLEPKWGTWVNEMNQHNVDQFKVFDLTGYIGTHSYIQYTSTGNPYKVDGLNSGASTGINYYSPLHRESVIFEGWIRPHGIIGSSSEVELFNSVSDDTRGLRVYINRSGEIRATVDFNINESALGFTGSTFRKVGPRSNGLMATGQTGSMPLVSNGYSVAWGDWNHIGVYQDTRTIGDTYTAANQPVIATPSGIYNGARSARLYLEINGNICNNIDVSLDAYTNNYISASSIGSSFPSSGIYPNTWPKIPSYAITGSTRTATFAQNAICDFDHIRFGIRDHVDAKQWSNVYGYKDTPPTFAPYDAIKVSSPQSGRYEHYQYAHIYNFDAYSTYLGWDNGFAPNHVISNNYSSLAADIYSRGIKPGIFFLRRDTGPKGRSALRIGPGQNIIVPWCSFDERIYNGPNTLSLVQGSSVINNAPLPYYSIPPSTWQHGNMPYVQSGVTGFSNTNADTKMLFGGFIKLHSYPITGFGDIMSFQEVAYIGTNQTFTPGTTVYSTASLYLGLNSSGNLVYGTCRTGLVDGTQNAFVFGQFTGGQIPLNTWTHVGLDCNLQLGTGYLKTYIDGELDSNSTLYVSTGGGLSSTSGRSLGYQGLLGGSVNSASNKPAFYIGGEHARDGGLNYQWMDFSVSEFFIGYPLSGYSWPWNEFASTGQMISGWYDSSVKDTSTKINYTIGTGVGFNALFNGVTLYPPTTYSGACEHMLWTTSNGGNDFEGLNLVGMPLLNDSLFHNAKSYYAIYENDDVVKTFGDTNSAIQLGNRVPNNGANLALISNKEWNTDSAVSTFDLSDQNYNNIIGAYSSDFTLSGLNTYWFGVISTGQVLAPDLRLSSFMIHSNDGNSSYPGYFMHLIGNEDKGLYLSSSPTHISMTGDYDLYHSTMNRIKDSIKVKNVNGEIIPFDTFPFDLIITPFSPLVDLTSLSGNHYGYGSGINTSMFNQNGIYTCILVANKQTIGSSVFIHYPSINYNGLTINFQDSDVYNPIPMLKHVGSDDVFDENGLAVIAPSGSFSTELNTNLKKYSVRIYGANLTGWV